MSYLHSVNNTYWFVYLFQTRKNSNYFLLITISFQFKFLSYSLVNVEVFAWVLFKKIYPYFFLTYKNTDYNKSSKNNTYTKAHL